MSRIALDEQRQAGILLHPTSLPEFSHSGCLGQHAYRFIDFLHICGQQVWQMLPVGPTHEDDSPYQPLSAYAGNSHFIDVQALKENGWLDQESIDNNKGHQVLLDLAFNNFYTSLGGSEEVAFRNFIDQEKHWLRDFALFCVIRDMQHGKSWADWPEPLRDHDDFTLSFIATQQSKELDAIYFEQYVFALQWQKLKDYANQKGIKLFGDMPIFVALDSAEVWAQRRYFDVDESGRPRYVAGVPPDYFSETGQRWGNPLYNWKVMQDEQFDWWVRRCQHDLKRFDLIRIDHFRGFEAYWKIPVECETAVDGFWEKAPGAELFTVLCQYFPDHPFVAEDLGVITDEVTVLRKQFGLPGMNVLQFAFDGHDDNPHLPDNYEQLSVAYTGTHDNDTSLGWIDSLDEHGKHLVEKYIDIKRKDLPWPMIQAVMESRACMVIIPLQDVLMLDTTHRMNTPGTAEGNWQWGFQWNWLSQTSCAKLLHVTRYSGRLSPVSDEEKGDAIMCEDTA
ncbi:4-alpha-glucanotransferase [bacterium AH-315-E07]|nr:4-alpha-glucanotransferase [bacterium AH-315-E07]